MFWKWLFVLFLSNLVLFAKNNKKITINGRSIPLVTCANLIISIGLIPIDEKITPIRRTITAIILNRIDLRFVEKPKHPQTTYAAAIGAVIELVKPADSNPMAITYFEKLPYRGSRLLAKSTAFKISVLFKPAAVKRIHNEIPEI